MSNPPSDFDFKFLPDWVKEPSPKNLYANYEGEDADRPGRDFSRSKGDRRDRKPKVFRAGDNARGGGGQRRDNSRPPRRPEERERPPAQTTGAQQQERKPVVKVEFLPDENCALALAKQIKASTRAYPLFDLARMFLEKQDRHRVKISTIDGTATLHQCGKHGPVSFDRASMEKSAFALCKHLYYSEETTQGDPPKGNFTNVAKCRLSGTLLGPTNHHAYQLSVRKLYEERFSRRMAFAEYQRQIEVVTSPEAVEAWKEQARSVTTFKTLQEPEAVTFDSIGEAERHFRAHYLELSLKAGNSFEVSGPVSRNLPDRGLAAAVRQAWEAENRFPGHLMNHLRREFIHAGLYIFKHRNRIQLASAIRPTPFDEAQQSLSDSVTEILKVVGSTSKCTRADLAAKIMPGHQDDPTKHKAQLASDLHWLTHTGHVIEMHNGILELPVAPIPGGKKGEEKPRTPETAAKGTQPPPATSAAPTATESAPAPVSAQAEPKPVEAAPEVVEAPAEPAVAVAVQTGEPPQPVEAQAAEAIEAPESDAAHTGESPVETTEPVPVPEPQQVAAEPEVSKAEPLPDGQSTEAINAPE